ncbi:MAG: ABC transporter permease [Candidatus Reconcilbacillus cellulovorans]|uniref:ABC transporter permease n=1 Tax=Candidatus Reconcilbacillus cellulovorans TaxID=1906605 RepID=A0A2A6DXN6_9BACL|nr:MAG: ABC transporter permease [Candidatus Reconcilbacillus cellulovorans]
MIGELLTGAIRSGTSVLYASAGELIAERAGVINLGTEGAMVAGALGGFAVTVWTGNPWLGALGGGICGALLSSVHALLVVWRGANQLASGLTVMFFGLGLTAFFGRSFVSASVEGFNPVAIPGLSNLPWIGPILFRHDPLTYLSYILVPAVWFVLSRTRLGIVLRATGEREEVVFSQGFSPRLIRTFAVITGGFLAGVGGVQLSVAFTHAWVEGMTAGRGIVAAALVIFAAWKPFRCMAGAYLFGCAQSLQLVLQSRGADVSPFLLFMLPYVLTLAVLFLVERRRQSRIPEELGRVFSGPGGG